MQQPLLRLDLQYFADELADAPESTDWSSYLSEATTETDDDQPIVESEEEVVSEDAEEITEDAVEPDSDEETGEEVEEKPAFDDDTLIDLEDGTQPISLKELKAGNLRQADYTKKTQALAEERTAFESEKAEMEPVKDWVDYIKENPYLFQTVNQAIEQWNNTGVEIELSEVLDSEAGPYVNHLLSRVSELEGELNRVSGEYQTTKFDGDMRTLVNDLKVDYGDLITPEYEQSLITQAKEQGLSPDVLKRIAKGDLAEQKLQQTQQESKKVEAKTKQKMRETKLPPQPKNKGNTPAPKEVDSGGDWLSLFKQV